MQLISNSLPRRSRRARGKHEGSLTAKANIRAEHTRFKTEISKASPEFVPFALEDVGMCSGDPPDPHREYPHLSLLGSPVPPYSLLQAGLCEIQRHRYPRCSPESAVGCISVCDSRRHRQIIAFVDARGTGLHSQIIIGVCPRRGPAPQHPMNGLLPPLTVLRLTILSTAARSSGGSSATVPPSA